MNLIDYSKYPVRHILKTLLLDKSTKRKIIFNTNKYRCFGLKYSETNELSTSKVALLNIQPSLAMQDHPSSDLEDLDVSAWQIFVDKKYASFPCGEALFFTSRYDNTGKLIGLSERKGILDLKLGLINENTHDETEWFAWVDKAFKSIYGCEYDCDNLLISRINLLNTYVDNVLYKWGIQPDISALRRITNIICWNFFQINTSLVKENSNSTSSETIPVCEIYNWDTNSVVPFCIPKKDCSIVTINKQLTEMITHTLQKQVEH